MKSVSAGLNTHIQGETTTMATCFKVTRRDGTVLGFTTHTSDLVVDGVTYVADTSSYVPSNVKSGSDMSVDNVSLQALLDSVGITASDLNGGKYDYAQVEIFEVNYTDLTQGKLKLRTGTLGEVSTGIISFEAELRGLTQHLQQTIGRVYQKRCDADFGDARCGINIALHTITGEVTAVTSARQFTASAVPTLRGGLLTWTSGNNDGFEMEIESISGFVIVLALPMPYDIQVGDNFSAAAGCTKLLSTCRDTYNNVVNFRGFPTIPGNDVAMQYPDAK